MGIPFSRRRRRGGEAAGAAAGAVRRPSSSASGGALPRGEGEQRPCPAWDPPLEAYLSTCFGPPAWAAMKAALAVPPAATCVRSTAAPGPVTGGELTALLAAAGAASGEGAAFSAAPLPSLPGVALIRANQGAPPHGPDPPPPPPPTAGVVIVSRAAGEAVLLGAPPFAPGVLATTPGLCAGDAVAVRAVTSPKGGPPGMTRGCVVADAGAAARLAPVFLGTGELVQPRAALFGRGGTGPAVHLTHRVHPAPSAAAWVPRGAGIVQHLASCCAAAAVGVVEGGVVLDMCAAPGAKATALAAALRGRGVVVALDKSRPRLARLEALAVEAGVGDVLVAVRADATRLFGGGGGGEGGRVVLPDPKRRPWAAAAAAPPPNNPRALARAQRKAALAASSGQRLSAKAAADAAAAGLDVSAGVGPAAGRERRGGAPPTSQHPSPAAAALAAAALAAPARFTHVLLDAPCTGLGLRPRLAQPTTAADVSRAASYQRALFRQAVAALAAGGTLVYSTCSIAPAENEGVVAFALAAFSCLTLVDASPVGGDGRVRLGGPGLVGSGPAVGGGGAGEQWLPDAAAAALVRRFNPASPGLAGGDTIGFFIAKFRKQEEG
jgi:16S rRNA C967 or C1407 C5-methylase (RsmB/RsmF family)